MKCFIIALCLTATTVAAQENDMDRRIKELERQVDILSREIESLKSGQKPVAAEANTTQYGLGAGASKVYRSEPGVSFGGYGEFAYQNVKGQPATADVLRAVLYTGYKFSDRALFNSELEVEDASTERGGNVSVEFAYLDYMLRPAANVRAGLLLVPMGLINEQHEPTAYLAARRPLTEQVIIPATWSELGAGVFGDAGRLSYRAYVMTGLQGGAFTGEEGIRGGRQGGGNAIAEDFAVVARTDFHPLEGTTLGGSVYGGHSGQGRAYRGRVGLGELHADSRFRGATVRALVARGSARDVQHVAESSDPIGSSFGGWYVEAGYDLTSRFGLRDVALTPYARYERADTQRRAAPGFVRNPENDRRIFTLGLSFRPISQTVIKVDWEKVNNRARTGADRFNLSLGYIF